MTTALDRLEKKSLVRRARDAADRRKVLVEMTEEAQRVSWEAMGPLAEEGPKLLEPYSNDDLVKFIGFLKAAVDSNTEHINRIRSLERLPSV
jgi:DNA-binding MarR family transcriptional regulator